jgi:hypothetical protein
LEKLFIHEEADMPAFEIKRTLNYTKILVVGGVLTVVAMLVFYFYPYTLAMASL